ncbi:group I truncated hemoglobin [Bacillus marasmi]|uniref:group I truncated hemoglobin n=1 Tax=Bacillus marasmi TaxID=1926279 RepID=UPI0011C7AED0|nr:group 1 truncated hemoglobin [Bacillus marasmi]
MDQLESIYERFGGEEKVGQMVDEFYKSVLEDPSLAKFFYDVDMETQKRHQTHFLSFIMGGPNRYSGRALAEAHGGINTKEDHFDTLINHLRTSMENHEMNHEEIEAVVQSISAYKQDIISG